MIRTSGFGFRASAAVFLAAAFVYGYRLWDAPLDRTEPHRALVAHQMVQGGSWLLPRLNGELYLRKPPLIYWVEAVAEEVTGHAEPWAWRLPSALGSACLAAVLAAWAGRWFGTAAVAPAGIACLALIPLWDQDRAADIDALNTVAAVVTAMLALELIYGPVRRRWPWVAGLAGSVAAMLLLKGPGGLPPVLGALVGPSILLRDWRWARRPGVWVGLAVGFAMFAGYGAAAKLAMRHAGLTADTGGLREALQRMVLHRWRDVLPAIVAPLTVLLYAVPVSLVVPLAWVVARYDPNAAPFAPGSAGADGGRRLVAILTTVAAGLLLFVLAGNRNPRYEYVLLPLLAMAVGGVAAGPRTAGETRLIRIGLTVFAVLFVILQLAVSAKVWPAGQDRIGLVVAAAVSVVAAAAWVGVGGRTWLAGLVVVALAVPLVDRKNLERQQRSTRNAAAQLRLIVGPGPVAVASENRDTPELFFYAGVPVRAFGERGLAKLAAEAGGRWVVLSQNRLFPEYATLTGAGRRGVPARGGAADDAQPAGRGLRGLVRPAGRRAADGPDAAGAAGGRRGRRLTGAPIWPAVNTRRATLARGGRSTAQWTGRGSP